jgi:hypothetical protein
MQGGGFSGWMQKIDGRNLDKHPYSDMKKFLSKLLILSLILSTNSFAGSVLIYEFDESIGSIVSARQTVAGNNPTVTTFSGSGYSNLNPSGLNTYSQVWDLAATNIGALNSNIISAYTSYLSQGGTLFLMGENDSFMTRNNSIFSLISTLGGGSVSQGSNSSFTNVTIIPQFRTANTTSIIQFPTAGTFSSIGNGTCITSDCAAVLYSPGKLGSAAAGTLIVVLDINFVQSFYSSGVYKGQDFTDDLISYLNSPFVIVSPADTQSSMRYQASQLRSAFNTQTVAANFALNYDCNVFDVKGMCISAGGRYTTIDNPGINNSAAVVALGYKVNPNIRIGAYLDQNINISKPTGIDISNNTPLMGLYAVWNKEQSGLGYQVRVANTYQDKDVAQTRTVFDTSEAGSGKSSLKSQSYLAELSYAFQYEDKTLVRPYAGLRYTHLKQDGYTEGSVDNPLTVAALRDKGTTALLGVKINRSLTDKATLTAQLGLEQDVHHKVGNYSATNSNIGDLDSVAFNSNIKRTRPVASIGAFYDVTKTQRASATINYQQLPFQSTGSATAYFNYMIGF